MISVSFYDTATGKILRKAMLHPDMVEANLNEGEGWIEGFYDPSLFVIKDGHPQKIDDEEIEAAQIEEAWSLLRMTRDSYLAASDWTQVPDAPVDQAAWAEYRQALRDLPANTTDPRNPDWPALPA
jgi:hypothetical protein